MSEFDNGGSAFPLKEALSNDNLGMTLRDYFAAKAMQGMSTGEWPNLGSYQEIAKRAYVMADAMLKARQK